MDWVPVVIALLAGFALGLGVAFILRIVQAKGAKELANELFIESEAQRKANIDAVIENVKASFGNLSLEALSLQSGEPGAKEIEGSAERRSKCSEFIQRASWKM